MLFHALRQCTNCLRTTALRLQNGGQDVGYQASGLDVVSWRHFPMSATVFSAKRRFGKLRSPMALELQES